jgi:hypothetical protein
MCVFPASHLKVHAAIEKGLADDQSVFADFFCSWRRLFCFWRHPFSLDDLNDSVAKRPKFQPKNIQRADTYFENWENRVRILTFLSKRAEKEIQTFQEFSFS